MTNHVLTGTSQVAPEKLQGSDRKKERIVFLYHHYSGIFRGPLGKKTSKQISWWFKVTFLGWLSDPFKGLSDLQLGDEKVTLNHLDCVYFCWAFIANPS